MKNRIIYYINHWYDIPLVKQIILWSKKVILPGFKGIPLFYIIRFLVEETKQDRMMTRANSMAFSFFLSLFPAIIFLFTLLPHLDITHQLDTSIANSIYRLLPRTASDYLLGIIHDITGIKRQGLLSFGFLLAVYFSSQGVLTMMIGFDKSHIRGFGTRTYFEKRFVSLGITIVLLLLVISSGTLIILGDLIFGFIDNLLETNKISTLLVSFFRWILAIFIVYLAITIIYIYAPSMNEKLKFWNIGSFTATVMSVLTSLFFAFFVNNFGRYNEIYGSIGALIVLMLWLKINAFILLFGFELNTSVLANRNRIMDKQMIKQE